MKKLLIGGASIAALAAGSLAVATLSPVHLALASNSAPAVEVQAGQAPGTTQPGTPGQGTGRPGARVDQALDDLVKDGTLTQDQANKVKDKLKSSVGGGPGGRGGPGFFMHGLDEVAKSIGIPPEQLMTELRSGKSIAEVAQAHNVDPQKVINDAVAAATKRIDDAVASGKLPADRAAEMKSRLTDMITKMVNAKHDPNAMGPGFRRPGGNGPSDGTTDGGAAPSTAPPTTPPPSGGRTDGTAKPGN